MQQCRMNGDVFRRNDDGKLFLNGKEIIKNTVDAGYRPWQIALIFLIAGLLIGISI